MDENLLTALCIALTYRDMPQEEKSQSVLSAERVVVRHAKSVVDRAMAVDELYLARAALAKSTFKAQMLGIDTAI